MARAPVIARREPPGLGISRAVLALVFIAGGTLHFVIPHPYMGVMPPWLPWPFALVLVSGAAEIAGGVGLLVPRLRRAAGIGLIVLLIAVLPANVQMYLNAHAAGKSPAAQTLLLIRLPLQFAIIYWVWIAAGVRGARPRTTRR